VCVCRLGLRWASRFLLQAARATADDALGRAVDYILAGWQEDLPVVAGNAVVGIPSREDIVGVITQRGSAVQVGKVIRHNIQSVDSHDAAKALALLQSCSAALFPCCTMGGR